MGTIYAFLFPYPNFKLKSRGNLKFPFFKAPGRLVEVNEPANFSNVHFCYL